MAAEHPFKGLLLEGVRPFFLASLFFDPVLVQHSEILSATESRNVRIAGHSGRTGTSSHSSGYCTVMLTVAVLFARF
jgi:hypothetical protein